jgi:uncharacterized repeat protein (TIGR03806 family)
VRAVVVLVCLVGCGDNAARPDATLLDGAPDTPDAAAVVGLDQRPANPTCKAFTPPPASGQTRLVSRFPNVTLQNPTGMFQRPGDNARWYVTERGGRLVSFPNNPLATTADIKVALDLRAVTHTQWDCSLSGIAFPANFATSKRAYVSYCYKGPQTGDSLQVRVSRFATDDGGLTFDPASEQVIVAIDHPNDAAHPNIGLHTSDAMRFGADGYLYLAIGDGGPQGIGGGTQAQNPNDLRGKLLRVDVSDLSKQLVKDFVPARQRLAVDIPADNPFVAGGGHPAVWAYGFRNPWQWHFDRLDGSIWLGDVGNGSREEINRGVVKGGNYGWSAYEGFNCTNNFPTLCTVPPTLKMPLLDYAHGSGDQQGNAVTGGVVYRGNAVPSLRGSYIFGDSSGQRIWAVRDVDTLAAGVVPPKELLFRGAPVSSFALDQDGELYATILFPTGTYGAGTILALEEAPLTMPMPGEGPPVVLSATGCFEPDAKTPLPALVPFQPRAELYSDGATKRRWLALPDGKTIAIAPDGDFDFPPGSVLVKEFSLGGKRIETRFFVRQDADARWAGYSYRWREDESDADLVGIGSETRVVDTQTWTYPSRAQCHQCHTNVAGSTLGLELAQLDSALAYPATGRTANQLATLTAVGMLDPTTAHLTPLAAIDDTSRTNADRARGYLHANCGNCHRPDGPTFTPLDLRWQTPFADAGLCDQLPTIDDLATLIPADPRILAPGAPDRSVLWHRLSTTQNGLRMPPIARTLTHEAARTVISDWITATTSCP